MTNLVLLHGIRAGVLVEDDNMVRFAYDGDYLLAGGEPVAGLPIAAEAYDLLSIQPFLDADAGLRVVPARQDATGRWIMAIPLEDGPP